MVFLPVTGPASATAWAQQGTGSIFGTVTDPQGAAVPDAILITTHTPTNFSFRRITNDAGYYTASALPVGTYLLAVEKEGFKRVARPSITLQVDQRLPLDVRLEVGAVAESIEVPAEAVLVETGSATVAKVVENRRISDLPLNARNALALTLLTPGSQNSGRPDQQRVRRSRYRLVGHQHQRRRQRVRQLHYRRREQQQQLSG
jgi:hypothetical protein